MSDTDHADFEGPDLDAEGAAIADIPEGGMLLGHFQGGPVVLIRKGGSIFAVGGKCTHYGGPLGQGLFDGELLHCPWHHACFRPETGEAAAAPAIDPIPSFTVEQQGGRVFVRGAKKPSVKRAPIPSAPRSVLIIGGGAAGFAAAETLRREGYQGPVTIVSADDAAPYDRPNLSKDYLVGTAQSEWMPLRPPGWYGDARIELLLGARIAAVTPAKRQVRLEDGRSLDYGALLLATGASPVRLDVPGADLPHVHYLRTMRDCDSIIDHAKRAKRAVVVGAGFIGLEVAASLVARGLDVQVVAPEAIPMERVLGPELGGFVRILHEERGVRFHLGQTLGEIGERSVTLQSGARLEADLVVLGVGVRPNVELAEEAGLTLDRGILVDEYLRTSAEGVWAAGDIALWPDRFSGERIRVEHWVVAERQGQTAARNVLGRREAFRAAPFFWSQHYDVTINYVGYASSWDEANVVGNIADRDCLVAYRKAGKIRAVATIYRDIQSLQAQAAMDRGDAQAVEALIMATAS
ncbi:MAG TPA: FAD-dependent oxidoreductase [Methylomirabilota bacterium]|nr:FAD-dependent oxidoreductase [Methylomirabilota bacterium]